MRTYAVWRKKSNQIELCYEEYNVQRDILVKSEGTKALYHNVSFFSVKSHGNVFYQGTE